MITLHLLDVFMLVDTWGEGRGEALVDVRFSGQFLQGLNSIFGEELLLSLLVHTVQALLVCLPEVDGIYVSLVDSLDVALPWVYSHWDGSVDA